VEVAEMVALYSFALLLTAVFDFEVRSDREITEILAEIEAIAMAKNEHFSPVWYLVGRCQ
jgi:hypothetical protein